MRRLDRQPAHSRICELVDGLLSESGAAIGTEDAPGLEPMWKRVCVVGKALR